MQEPWRDLRSLARLGDVSVSIASKLQRKLAERVKTLVEEKITAQCATIASEAGKSNICKARHL